MPRKMEISRALQKRAESMIPGGVNSPVRAFQAVGGDAPFMVSGEGSRLFDADGNEYIDYVGSWGPLILGHSAPDVVEAVIAAVRNGTSFGASTPSEADLAELVIAAFPHIQKIRFVNSGTEATMSAIRLARAYTKRKYVIKFEGCYHGHADALLVKAGSGVATLGIPGSAGVPEEFAQFTLALPFGDLHPLEEAFKKFKHQIACVIGSGYARDSGLSGRSRRVCAIHAGVTLRRSASSGRSVQEVQAPDCLCDREWLRSGFRAQRAFPKSLRNSRWRYPSAICILWKKRSRSSSTRLPV